MSQYFLYLKAFHIISVVAYFAGLFYIFRLFVYHVQNKTNHQMCEVFAVMEKKLLRIIMAPAAAATLASGVMLASMVEGYWLATWLHAKLLFVSLVFAYHHLAGRTAKKFARGEFYLSERSCRIINEVPTIALVGAVILVVVKP